MNYEQRIGQMFELNVKVIYEENLTKRIFK